MPVEFARTTAKWQLNSYKQRFPRIPDRKLYSTNEKRLQLRAAKYLPHVVLSRFVFLPRNHKTAELLLKQSRTGAREFATIHHHGQLSLHHYVCKTLRSRCVQISDCFTHRTVINNSSMARCIPRKGCTHLTCADMYRPEWKTRMRMSTRYVRGCMYRMTVQHSTAQRTPAKQGSNMMHHIPAQLCPFIAFTSFFIRR